MLLGIPKILSPEIIATLCEMGHSDVIVIGDANFPGKGRLGRQLQVPARGRYIGNGPAGCDSHGHTVRFVCRTSC